jgi:hypothetical protein
MSEHVSNVLIHIDETLATRRLEEIEQHLSMEEGIYSACVNDQARHLMVVDYDPEDINSMDILQRVQREGVHAELIGF